MSLHRHSIRRHLRFFWRQPPIRHFRWNVGRGKPATRTIPLAHVDVAHDLFYLRPAILMIIAFTNNDERKFAILVEELSPQLHYRSPFLFDFRNISSKIKRRSY